MRFDPPLVPATFVRRYKRFFVDATLADGRTVVAHCPNTGSLAGVLRPGAPALLAPTDRPGRKLKWSFVMIHGGRSWIGVDTGRAVPLVREAIEAGVLPELTGFERIVPEVPYGPGTRSRIDLLLSSGGRPQRAPARRGRVLHEGDARVYVEVKNTTLTREVDGQRAAAFPDAVTERGRKHLVDLQQVVRDGQRAAMVYSIQRSDCAWFEPADDIDPAYGQELRRAAKAGVELYALAPARVTRRGLRLTRRLPIRLP